MSRSSGRMVCVIAYYRCNNIECACRGQLYHSAKERWPAAQQETRQAMARMAAAAAWGLGKLYMSLPMGKDI